MNHRYAAASPMAEWDEWSIIPARLGTATPTIGVTMSRAIASSTPVGPGAAAIESE